MLAILYALVLFVLARGVPVSTRQGDVPICAHTATGSVTLPAAAHDRFARQFVRIGPICTRQGCFY